jgi:phenylacetate-CoA ligase
LTMQIGGPYMVNAAEKYGLRVMALSSYTTPQKVALLERFDPHALLITPAYAMRLEDEARKAGHDRWGGRLKGVLIVGESYTDRWIHAVNEYWGAPTYEYYGTSQSGMGHTASCHLGILQDGKRGMMHNLEPYHLCEVIDPETGKEVGDGEVGEVVQTPLFKFASPVIRFRTDDRAIRRVAESCRCGSSWDGLLAGEISRYDDMIKAKGQNFWPSAVHEVIDAMFPGVEYRGRVFVDESGRERIELVVEGDEAELTRLVTPLRDRTNLTMEIKGVAPGSLDRFEFKSRRWEDTRRHDREVIAYREKR